MGGIGDGAEERYQVALRAVRENAAALIPHAQLLYEKLPAERYLDRWSLVQLLADVEDPQALEFLDELVTTPVPSEESKEVERRLSTVAREILIRTTAIDAIARLARKGNERALKALRRHTRNDNFSVKRAAVQAYIESAGEDASRALRRFLPPDDRDLLKIRRIDVRDAPEVTVGSRRLKRDPFELPPRSRQRKRTR
jgi:HEAT repeat protein